MRVTRERLLEVLDAQRAAFPAELPVSIAVRRDRLRRAAALLSENAQAFCDAASHDFGHRSRKQTMLTDVNASIRSIRHCQSRLAAWMKPSRRSVDFPLGLLGARAVVEYQPKGVVGIVPPRTT